VNELSPHALLLFTPPTRTSAEIQVDVKYTTHVRVTLPWQHFTCENRLVRKVPEPVYPSTSDQIGRFERVHAQLRFDTHCSTSNDIAPPPYRRYQRCFLAFGVRVVPRSTYAPVFLFIGRWARVLRTPLPLNGNGCLLPAPSTPTAVPRKRYGVVSGADIAAIAQVVLSARGSMRQRDSSPAAPRQFDARSPPRSETIALFRQLSQPEANVAWQAAQGPVCRNFAKGSCPRASCRWAHVGDAGGMLARAASALRHHNEEAASPIGVPI
jgi:hypothetical protein